MYHWIDAFDKPAFGTAGSEARTNEERCSVKYSLILLSAFLVVACGGLTKEQQATAYGAAAEKWNPATAEAEAIYEAASEAAMTDDESLIAITELYSSYAGIDRIFADDLAEVEWTSEFKNTAEKLINCTNEAYLLEIAVLSAADLQEAIDLSDAADEKVESCDIISRELEAALGMEPAKD
jgi:hypothetical protein